MNSPIRTSLIISNSPSSFAFRGLGRWILLFSFISVTLLLLKLNTFSIGLNICLSFASLISFSLSFSLLSISASSLILFPSDTSYSMFPCFFLSSLFLASSLSFVSPNSMSLSASSSSRYFKIAKLGCKHRAALSSSSISTLPIVSFPISAAFREENFSSLKIMQSLNISISSGTSTLNLCSSSSSFLFLFKCSIFFLYFSVNISFLSNTSLLIFLIIIKYFLLFSEHSLLINFLMSSLCFTKRL